MTRNFYEDVKSGAIELRVLIFRRPNFRDENLEYERFIGRAVLDDLFDNMKERDDTELFLSYPEQWLNILEQRVLFDRIARYLPNIKKITIKTHSVYIIQCTPNTSAFIVDEAFPETSDTTVKLYNTESTLNLFDVTKLNVIGGKLV